MIEGANIEFVSADVNPVHTELVSSAGNKNIWIVGGGNLAGQFYDAGLLDEIIVQIGSATLGNGKPIFPREVLAPVLSLVSIRQMGSSMVELRYNVQRTKSQ